MATPGFTINYTDPDTGANYPNAWVVIKTIVYGNPSVTDVATSLSLQASIFMDQASFENGKMPVVPNLRAQSNFGDWFWIEFFAIAVLQEANHDLATQSYAFLQSFLQGSHKKKKVNI